MIKPFKYLKTTLVIYCLLASMFTALGQTRIKVIDHEGLSVPLALLQLSDDTWSETNEDGFVSLTLTYPINIHCSRIGFQDLDTLLTKETNRITLVLIPHNELAEITILAEKTSISRSIKSGTQLTKKFIDQIPNPLGTSDFTRALKILPSVQGSYDFSSGLLVRGGSVDQNQYLLDNVPVYSMNHILGVLPVFNGEVIRSLDFFNGPIPARYGGRLSSVVSVNTKTANHKKFKGKWHLGLLDADFTLEIPIIKNKLSLLTSTRSLHIGPLLLIQNILYNKNKIKQKGILGFYDTYNKLNYIINETSGLSISFFYNRDYLSSTFQLSSINEKNDKLNWGNRIFSINYHKKINTKVSFKQVLASSKYYRETGSYYLRDSKLTESFDSKSKINDYSLKSFFDIFLSNKMKLNLGGFISYRQLEPSRLIVNNQPISDEKFITNTYGVYNDILYSLNRSIDINAGFRYSLISTKGRTYHKFDPRFSVLGRINKNWNTSMSYTRTSQSVFNVGSKLIGLTDEFWFQVNKDLAPQYADLITINGEYTINDHRFNLSLYYKKLYNQIDDQVALLPQFGLKYEDLLDDLISGGEGRSMGLELWSQLKFDKHQVIIAYTLSKTERKFKEIFKGEYFPWTFDRRHNLNIVYSKRLTKKWFLTSNFLFQSGIKYSLPSYSYVDLSGQTVHIYKERNNHSLEPYHRLDIGFQKKWKKKNKIRTWHINIINIYNRKNISILKPNRKLDKTTNEYTDIIEKVTVLPLMISTSYSRTF